MSITTLSRRKRIRAGQRASATKAIGRAEDLLSSAEPHVDKLSQLKFMLCEKLDVLNRLDGEILDMVEEEAMADEIDNSDGFKEGVYTVMVRIERALTPAPAAPGPTPIGRFGNKQRIVAKHMHCSTTSRAFVVSTLTWNRTYAV